MKSWSSVILIGLLLASGPAEAREALSTALLDQPDPRPAKSRTTATLLALGGTLVPVVLGATLTRMGHVRAGLPVFALGLTVGPSLGHYYAGEYGVPMVKTLVRGGFSAASVAVMLDAYEEGQDCHNSLGCIGHGIVMMAGSLLMIPAVGLAIWDLIDASFAAKRVNRKLLRRRRVSFSPMVSMQPSQRSIGAAVSVVF
jgi:hypothetical protein